MGSQSRAQLSNWTTHTTKFTLFFNSVLLLKYSWFTVFNFCCTSKWFSYTYIYIFLCFPWWFIIGYWLCQWFSVPSSKMIFIHPIYNSLHLLTPAAHSPSPPQVCSVCPWVSFCIVDKFVCVMFLDPTYLLFSRSVMSSSLRPREPQHARFPCPSPSPGDSTCKCYRMVFAFLSDSPHLLW